MSTPSGNLYHPINSHPVPIYSGWFFLAQLIFWGISRRFMIKSMWGWAIISFLLSLDDTWIFKFNFSFFCKWFASKLLTKAWIFRLRKK